MLVLSRKVEEAVAILLPDDKDALADLAGRIILVRFVGRRPGGIRLAVKAPKEVKVLREELVDDEQRRRDEHQSRR
jgi:sRNA-binding carbon storage regulator CsrA